MIIELLRKTGVRLLTSGKVCMENIEVVPRLQSKSVTSNGAVEPDDGYAGLEQVTVNVPVPSGTLSITENGTYDVTEYASAEIEVAGSGGGGLPAVWDIFGVCVGEAYGGVYTTTGSMVIE